MSDATVAAYVRCDTEKAVYQAADDWRAAGHQVRTAWLGSHAQVQARRLNSDGKVAEVAWWSRHPDGMSGRDIGPYETEQAARRAAFEVVAPEDGWSILRYPQNVELLRAALRECGVEHSGFEEGTIRGLGHREDFSVAIIAGLIRRAHAAGKQSQASDGNGGPAAQVLDDDHAPTPAQALREPLGQQTPATESEAQ